MFSYFQATLGASARKGEVVRLKCRRADEGQDALFLCSLIAGSHECQLLDLIFDEYIELSIDGETEIHVTGFTAILDDDSSSYDDEVEEARGKVRMLRDQPETDSDSDSSILTSDDSSSYSMSDISYPSDISDSSYDDDDDSSSYDDEAADLSNKTNKKGKKKTEPEYIIEEITDDKKASSPTKQEARGKKEKKEEKGSSSSSNKRSASQALESPSSPKKKDKGNKKSKQQSSTPASSSSKEEGSGGKGGESSKSAKATAKGKSSSSSNNNKNASSRDRENSGQQIQRFPNGLEIINTAMGKGNGKLANPGKRVYCKYVGRLKKTGQVFDKSNKPFSFRLGVGEVIAGWDIGIKGMRVGDKRRITVPPELGYGNVRTGPIPKNSTLVFDVELVDVR